MPSRPDKATGPGPTIRPVRLEDAMDLRDLLSVQTPILEVITSIQRSLDRVAEGREIRLVASLGGRAVGEIQVALEPHPSPRAHRGEIAALAVARPWQGRGIGRALLEEAALAAAARRVCLLTVEVRGGAPVEGFFRACGYLEYGRLRGGVIDPWSGARYDDVLMHRDLAGPREAGPEGHFFLGCPPS